MPRSHERERVREPVSPNLISKLQTPNSELRTPAAEYGGDDEKAALEHLALEGVEAGNAVPPGAMNDTRAPRRHFSPFRRTMKVEVPACF